MENVSYLAGKDGSLVSPCLIKHRSKSPGRRRDVARKFWASVIPAAQSSLPASSGSTLFAILAIFICGA